MIRTEIQQTINQGLTTWQVVIIATVAGAAVLILDRLWDYAVDAYDGWRERRRDDPIEDAAELGAPDERFVPTPLTGWVATSHKIHRSTCPHAGEGAIPIAVGTEDGAWHWAQLNELKECSHCLSFTVRVDESAS